MHTIFIIISGEKPFVCQKCGKGCTTKGNLNKHVLSHCKGNTNEEPLSSTVSTLAATNYTDVTQNTHSQGSAHHHDLGMYAIMHEKY